MTTHSKESEGILYVKLGKTILVHDINLSKWFNICLLQYFKREK